MGGKPSKTPRGPKPSFTPPDPDFGWRQVPMEVDMEGIPHFVNERTGQKCRVTLVTLALNIARRSAILAERFGLFAQDQQPTTGGEEQAIYAALNCTDFGYRLISRVYDPDEPEQTGCCGPAPKPKPQQQQGMPGGAKLPPGAEPRGEDGAQEESEAGVSLLHKVEPSSGKILQAITANAGEIGMNLHEQILRLEKRAEQHQLPSDAFGWAPTGVERKNAFQVISPRDEKAFLVVPEELIMSVMQWIQVTYYTQAPAGPSMQGGGVPGLPAKSAV